MTNTVSPLDKSAQIAVIGAGTMGAGIAQVAAAYGHPVILFDMNPEAIERGINGVKSGLERQVARGKMTQEALDELLARISPATDIAALADSKLVIEAIIEDLGIKRGLLANLEATCAKDAILATNTSSISVTALGAEMEHPERLVGMHFFNPAPIMKLVEIVSGLATSQEVAEVTHATASAWGKQAVYTKSTPGFIVNRVARPFYAESLRIYEEGAADTATLDQLIKGAGGFRMGAFELTDLIGHDVNYAVTCSVFDAYYQDPRFLPSLTQKALVECGRLGRKSGHGFYDYSEGAEKPAAAVVTGGNAPASVQVVGDLGVANALVERIEAKGITVEKQTSESESYLKVGNARLCLSDGRFATEVAAEGNANTALFDLALDYNSATALAVAFADQCAEDAKQDVIGLFNALEINLSVIDDVPGLVVMRTVAMLANEAADAVNQGVCTAADADVAMRGGVNYPKGPLAWADEVGIAHIFNTLSNLQQCYGEDRYRPSALLRRKFFAGASFHG
ncbi:3-hydroxyacyl-CoA dehydrogenase PaaH [Neptuniibacter sp.]|uniref:3-hydroxyacyl-CoA dehydrogenase PaaH n=1 Tax=Neptuniibacter sp. TaxID=1962643 RepID=UPI0026147DF7|nr:3-hydroxyacyl-CoA dehydrogenase PaaH [Neptuniibacter sp.]MCP4597750.1 3-hydroxyacyl-CoA dehydrogenase PaaC [Neptuniibacter sp.]